MKARMKKLFFVTDDEGKQILSVLRAGIALGATLLVGAMLTWFTWVTTQAYDVATNKARIADTGLRLEKSLTTNEYAIKELQEAVKESLERSNTILHMRITKVDDKYDAKISELQRLLIETNKLIVDIMVQKNKEVEAKKEEVQIQKKQLDIMQQQSR